MITKAIHNCDPIDYLNNGSVIRDYLYIEDLLNLIILAIEGKPVGIYNAGYGKSYSVFDIINIFESQLGIKFNKNNIENNEYYGSMLYLNVKNTMKSFKWKPQTNIPNGILKSFIT